jgi:hypothetical protein
VKGVLTRLSLRLRLPETRQEAQAEILAAYAQGGSLAGAARILGVSIGTVRRFLEDPELVPWAARIRMDRDLARRPRDLVTIRITNQSGPPALVP